MLKIAITPENIDERNEALMVSALIANGWDRVHLRHPSASLSDMRRLIESIPRQMHPRLVVHDHFDLIGHYCLGGLHLNRRCPAAPKDYKGGLSRSCHSIDEVMDCRAMDYVTLSPIFDSISKSGYTAAYTHEELSRLTGAPTKVIALGGVNPERISFLRRYNFTGFAMLGALPWGENVSEMTDFIKDF
ncbi:thiamine phosphate synthase [uncultured Duncaniella sp.]|uniref:thiamine phosphate synthase n=1 Tax=uncultured Duncaniella sp. TaxID=2768039 RepID=UPI0025E24949|nr:thiamine phosphate synthase [uncultured Duncaniella sp.]